MSEAKLIKNLKAICLLLSKEMIAAAGVIPDGRCYIFGHVLAEGLKLAGFNAREVSGTLILTDKHDKKIIYGTKNYKGKSVGDFHTWCVLNLDGKELIIDPSLEYNRVYLKQESNIKLNQKIPDTYIGYENKSWHLSYFEDSTLTVHSKECLKGANASFISHIINYVKELVTD
jgi:hypothetical protein